MRAVIDPPQGHAWPEFPPGLVWLVGAGPGDPGLMTVEGLHALRQADVIVHDALADARILDWRRPGARLEFAGKRGGKPSATQADISLRLVALSRAGKRVVRLKGGDPFVFGRGAEEAEALVRAGRPFRVTPGITAGVGGLAHAGVPVTHRAVGQAVTFITGHDAAGTASDTLDWGAIARGAPVLVLYMAMKHLAVIAARLIAEGRDPAEPVLVAADAARPGMAVVETTLARAAADVAAAGVAPPAIVCVGRVALCRQMLDWAAQLRGERPRSLDPLGLGETARDAS